MKHSVIGLLAHVDAGKTTLSEALLYQAGGLRKRGRVDHQNSFLDYEQQERDRGITIFAKQAELSWKDCAFTLIDTPGHADLAAEMERTLPVLDYALLIISANDGVQAHTQTIWRLLQYYRIPTFLFINKMDLAHRSEKALLQELTQKLDERCISFQQKKEDRDELIALCGDRALQEYMEKGAIREQTIADMVRERCLFPCFFGSALKGTQIDVLLDHMCALIQEKTYPEAFGARIYKVTRDEQGNRLTWLKVTGGTLTVRTKLYREEKADQLRCYNGNRYTLADTVAAGRVCAVKGLRSLYPGEGLGKEAKRQTPQLEAYLTYRLSSSDTDTHTLFQRARELAQEDPQLRVQYHTKTEEVRIHVMGPLQLEVLQRLMKERFGLVVSVDKGNVVYRETIMEAVEGVGHYEPLRHYAEVHVLLEPLPPGSGIEAVSACSQEQLAVSWQNQILSYMREIEHVGVLSGSALCDMRMTLLGGKAHLAHTEGGDFKEATCRAIRHALRRASGVLLEPYAQFRMELAPEQLSRVIYDIERIHGRFSIQEKDASLLVSGTAPLAALQEYAKEFTAYTHGEGHLFYTWKDYEPCVNADAVLEAIGYDCDRDARHPCGSIFCQNGAGVYVPWDEVEQYMHLPFLYRPKRQTQEIPTETPVHSKRVAKEADDAELVAIFERTYGSQKPKTISDRESYERHVKQREQVSSTIRPHCLLVDGYNIIHDWEELRQLAQDNMDAARERLIDRLASYQGYRGGTLIVVFDAYKRADSVETLQRRGALYVIYTKTAQTADSYIEAATHRLAKDYQVTVATSDGMEQLIAISQGAMRISARQLKREIELLSRRTRQLYEERQKKGGSEPLAALRKWNGGE